MHTEPAPMHQVEQVGQVVDRRAATMTALAIEVEDQEEAVPGDQLEVREAAILAVVVAALGAAQAEARGALQVVADRQTEF